MKRGLRGAWLEFGQGENLCQELWIDCIFLCFLNALPPLSGRSDLLQPNSCSPTGKVSFLSACLHDSFFDSGFQEFDYGVCYHGFIWAYAGDSVGFLNLQVQALLNLGNFQPFFSGMFFQLHFLFLSTWDSCDTNVKSFVIVSQVSEALFFLVIPF